MNGTLNRLDTVHEKLSVAIRSTDPSLYSKRPGENEWSIAEVVQHLCMVEERVLEALKKGLERGPAKVGFLKKLIPMRLVSLRFMKLKAPKMVTPNNPPAMDRVAQRRTMRCAAVSSRCVPNTGATVSRRSRLSIHFWAISMEWRQFQWSIFTRSVTTNRFARFLRSWKPQIDSSLCDREITVAQRNHIGAAIKNVIWNSHVVSCMVHTRLS